MMEMAALSFNRVRLQYYVSKGIKRAIWLQKMLQKPSRLFGSVMLGVNIALQFGSQSSRELYQALHLDPDIAPLTQILLVVIFAELAPLFAARRFSEQVIMWGIPVVYATQLLFSPIIWLLGLFMRGLLYLLGGKNESFDIFLSREELEKILESHEEENEFNTVVSNIFSLRHKVASQVMVPLSKIDLIRSNTTVEELRKKMASFHQPFIPLFQKSEANIVAIALPRDVVGVAHSKLVQEVARQPWFITATTPLIQILGQFRQNKQSVAVVLDAKGSATGILSLDAIFEEIFGSREFSGDPEAIYPLIDRTFPGNTLIQEVNKEYGIHLPSHGFETLAQLVSSLLDHPAEIGDEVVIDHFILTVEEASLLGIKFLNIRTLET